MPSDHKPKEIAGAFDDNCIEYECGSDEKLTVKDYLGKVRPYLQDIIDDLKTFGV